MGLFSWLFGNTQKPVASTPQASKRPTWAAAIPVYSESIQLCSAPTPEKLFRATPRLQQTAGTQPVAAVTSTEAVIQPVAGADNAVPWPMPFPTGAHQLTFWGTGSAHTAEFALLSDGALRIVARCGPIKLRVQRQDGSFLDDKADLDGQKVRLGLMAISENGTYSLVVEASAGVDWGVTVLYSGPHLAPECR
jgi:hypothetical protein